MNSSTAAIASFDDGCVQPVRPGTNSFISAEVNRKLLNSGPQTVPVPVSERVPVEELLAAPLRYRFDPSRYEFIRLEFNALNNERQALVGKKIRNQITPREERRLAMIRWEMAILEEQVEPEQESPLAAAAREGEKLARDIQDVLKALKFNSNNNNRNWR